MADGLIGLELLLHCVKQDIKKKEDILLLLVHHSLLKAGFKCAGNGENWNDDDVPSEILPNEWNMSKEYTLRYKRDEDKFILMSNHTDDVIVLNLTSPHKMKVTNILFNIEESVKSLDGCISSMVPECENILQRITQHLVSPFIATQKVDTNTQTTEQSSKIGIIPVPDPTCSMRNTPYLPNINSIGRRDLDPLAAMGGGGGMLFDPLRENRSRLLGELGAPPLPRGAVPPGARYDPFGPPDNIIRGRPPPDYDMFG